jgi:predicted aspartyl protease
VKVTCFDSTRDLIIVTARIWGPRSRTRLSLAIDTGSSETVVTPEIIDELGYSARDGQAITTVRSAVGKEQGYTLIVKRFSALGFVVPDYRLHVFDLAAGYDIDGLIGLSLLRNYNYEIRSIEGRIMVERAVEES